MSVEVNKHIDWLANKQSPSIHTLSLLHPLLLATPKKSFTSVSFFLTLPPHPLPLRSLPLHPLPCPLYFPSASSSFFSFPSASSSSFALPFRYIFSPYLPLHPLPFSLLAMTSHSSPSSWPLPLFLLLFIIILGTVAPDDVEDDHSAPDVSITATGIHLPDGHDLSLLSLPIIVHYLRSLIALL